MRKNKIVWGIIILLVAVGLLLVAFWPELAFLQIKTWKWFIGIVLLFWLFKKLLFGYGLAGHLSFFIPLALLAMLFESDIARFIGKESDWFNNWLVLGGAILLTIAVNFIFKGSFRKNVATFKFSESGVSYFDYSSAKSYSVKNKLGETTVYCQNLDKMDENDTAILNVINSLGETTVHVPENCVVVANISNGLGDVSVRPNTTTNGKKMVINGQNKLGDINVVSP